jgi:hypothetical protein
MPTERRHHLKLYQLIAPQFGSCFFIFHTSGRYCGAISLRMRLLEKHGIVLSLQGFIMLTHLHLHDAEPFWGDDL